MVGIILALCVASCCYTRTADAQGLSGIKGTITDQSDAVVPDAKVTVTNTGTNVVHTATTTSQGTFFITDLIPGTYTVKIEKAGFQTASLNAVNVYASQTATADATLRAGANTITVEVQAPMITLQTDEPTLGTVIQSTIVEEVPNFIGGGRDRQIDSFLFLAPGVTGGAFSHRINGGIDFQNEVMFNGVVIAAAETQGFQTIYNPPYELVNEPDIITNNFSAQYGFADGVASYKFKSGTNQLHGDLFEINRNSFFDARGVNPPGSFVNSSGVFVKGPVPYDAYDASRPLETGMVVSVETTLAHPRRGFIKLEDTVVVTDSGFEIFGEGGRGWNRGGTAA